jgi:hypothetical protein
MASGQSSPQALHAKEARDAATTRSGSAASGDGVRRRGDQPGLRIGQSRASPVSECVTYTPAVDTSCHVANLTHSLFRDSNILLGSMSPAPVSVRIRS